VQKFTRPITREIEFAGLRLAVTFGENGIEVRPVGSRKPPREVSWPAFLCFLTGHHVPLGQELTADELALTAEAIKSPPSQPRSPAPTHEPHQPPHHVHEEPVAASGGLSSGGEFHSPPHTP